MSENYVVDAIFRRWTEKELLKVIQRLKAADADDRR
jgi:hypothetical protein